jgi:hypothetical protein
MNLVRAHRGLMFLLDEVDISTAPSNMTESHRWAMSHTGRDAPLIAMPRPLARSTLETLAFFRYHHEGRCEDVARVTGLSHRTARRRLCQLVEIGVLDAVWTKTFPSMRRFRLLENHIDLARSASTLLEEPRGMESLTIGIAPIAERRGKVRRVSAKSR